ncbi:MAG: tryptophan--tRNA ligase [Candidatus Aenigmarchaeota archaeon]|nr:tryptophan--tRNA ligase [Candidatus Aenigmarchaeota archaeon]
MDRRIDPWGSEGVKDYDRLVKDFGIEPIQGMVKKVPDNLLFRRGAVFGHQDFGRIADSIKQKKDYVMLTGLMPSGKFHIGHKMLAEQMIYYQQNRGKVFICVADVEAYNMRKASLKDLRATAIEEYLTNYIALGLKPKGCDFYFQSSRSGDAGKANAYHRLAAMASRKTTTNEMKAIYGEVTPGKIMSVMHQVADILHPQLKEFGGERPVVVPVGVDQSPHIRFCRGIASRFTKSSEYDFIPPSATYHKFMKGLKGGKMSSSDPYSFIALTDSPKVAGEKIMKHAFSGGQGSVKEHRKKGGNPDIDVAYQMLYFGFEENDRKIKKIHDDYRSGKLLTGELKQILIEKMSKFLVSHQQKMEKARGKVGDFLG